MFVAARSRRMCPSLFENKVGKEQSLKELGDFIQQG